MTGQYSGNRIHEADQLAQKSITVTTSATELYTGVSRDPLRQVVRIYNDGPQVVYVGPSSVTSSGSTKGEPLRNMQSMTLDIGDVGLFAITANSTATLIITELS